MQHADILEIQKKNLLKYYHYGILVMRNWTKFYLCGEEGICLYLNENIGRAEDESCGSVFLFR